MSASDSRGFLLFYKLMRTKKPKAIQPTEQQIMMSILEWLALQPRTKAWRNNSVGLYSPTRKAFLKPGKFSNIGSADILGIYNGYFLAIEVKRPKGVVTEHQEAWLTQMVNLGALAFVARSLEDVQFVLKQIDDAIRAKAECDLFDAVDLKKLKHVGKTC